MTDAQKPPGSHRVMVIMLAFLGVSALALGGLIAIGCAIGANACPLSDRKPVAANDGRQIFVAECALCHGINGEGDRGPSLRSGAGTPAARQEIKGWVEDGSVGLMPRYEGKLSPQQIEAVTDYVFSLREDP